MRLSLTYHHLTHHIVPGPQSISYFLPLIFLPIALVIPQTILSRWQNTSIFLPAILAATIHAWKVMGCIDVISMNAVLWSFYFLLLRDPWKDFRRVRTTTMSESFDGTDVLSNGSIKPNKPVKSNETTQASKIATSNTGYADRTAHDLEEESYPPTLHLRILWVSRLLASIRLNNWKISLSSHDKHQPPPPAFLSRTQFFLTALLSFCRGYILLDLTSAYTHADPYFQNISIPITSPLPHPFSSQLGFIPPQLFRAMIIGLQAWVLISQMFYLPCLLPVSLNYLGILADEWSPHTWATYFGHPSSIFLHGIRGFWGQYWHQTMRHSCSGPGYALAELFKLKKGGLLRYMIINVVAFVLSGIVHMGLVPPEPLQATVTPNTIRLYIGGFFWLQPVGMLVELLAIRLFEVTGATRHLKESRGSTLRVSRLVINGVWVIFWFSLCLPLLGEAARQLEYSKAWLVPMSLWKLAIEKKEYVMW